ncbi:hypothetical protein Tcan_09891 [Toxocara canis]|uniref:Uncharacterized protein n=1 Tax=Toxocara canis TaxID=6265 RepID=A0A0B2VGP4_TOXCA|nr:hypothetical protein Tcan_09891 [Toxocara canis]
MERMMEEVAVRRRDQGTASDADTDDLVLSGVEFVADNEPYDLGQRRNNNSQGVSGSPQLEITGSERLSGALFGSDLAVGAEACNTPATSRPFSARKLHFDTTLSSTIPTSAKRSCLKSVNDLPAKAVTFHSEMARHRDAEIESVSSSDTCEDDSRMVRPFLHKYVDALNEVFAKAQTRINDLNLMRIASAELDKFAVDMQGSSKSAQFANIENLSAEEARHLLRAEMLRNEQSDVRIEMLTKRNVQLEKRLAVTDTAEKYYSLMKLDMEKKLKKLLEEMSEVEMKRIKLCTELVERNAKIEKRHTLSVAQNEVLNAQIATNNAKVIKLKQVQFHFSLKVLSHLCEDEK